MNWITLLAHSKKHDLFATELMPYTGPERRGEQSKRFRCYFGVRFDMHQAYCSDIKRSSHLARKETRDAMDEIG